MIPAAAVEVVGVELCHVLNGSPQSMSLAGRRAESDAGSPDTGYRAGRTATASASASVETAQAAEEPIHRKAGRYAWALLLARIDEFFPLLCPKCGSEIRIIAFVTKAASIRQTLGYLGEPSAPPIAPARGTPLWEMADDAPGDTDPRAQHSTPKPNWRPSTNSISASLGRSTRVRSRSSGRARTVGHRDGPGGRPGDPRHDLRCDSRAGFLASSARSSRVRTADGATTTKEKIAMSRVRKTAPVIFLAYLAITWSSVLSAQTLYRCGKTFQDRPCDGANGQVVGVNKAQDSQSSKPSSIATTHACAMKGDQAKELRWQKEGGKTESQQIQDGRFSSEFIRYVYSKSGTAIEVKASVESDCMAQLERDAQAAELQRAAERLRGGGNPPGASSAPAAAFPNDRVGPNPTLAPKPPAAEVGGKPSPGTADNSRCRSLNERERDIRNQQRAGGSAQTMDRLNSELRDILGQKSSNGC